MALLKRKPGGIQPSIPCGLLRIRLPFIHFNIVLPEVITGLMNACTSYGVLAVLISTLGLDPEIAWALIIFETALYSCSWLLGEPSICGWITPALGVVIVFLEGFAPGVSRLHALIALQFEIAALFLLLGATGISKRINLLIPPGVRAGIILGAGLSAVFGRLSSGQGFDMAPLGLSAALVVLFVLMFGARIKELIPKFPWLGIIKNYSFLWAVLTLMIVSALTGEIGFHFSGQIIKAPDFIGLYHAVSPFSIGFPPLEAWTAAFPLALIAWLIAYGDFVTVQQLGLHSQRPDEYIEFDINRSNVICGIRNALLGLFCPYPALAGPLSAPYCVAVYQRYKDAPMQGRGAMHSIYDGTGTNLIFTVIGMFLYPVYEASALASGPLLVLVLCLQGYICTQLAFSIAKDKVDQGVAGMLAGVMLALGAGIALLVGVILYFLVAGKKKVIDDYQNNKAQQEKEDEITRKLMLREEC